MIEQYSIYTVFSAFLIGAFIGSIWMLFWLMGMKEKKDAVQEKAE